MHISSPWASDLIKSFTRIGDNTSEFFSLSMIQGTFCFSKETGTEDPFHDRAIVNLAAKRIRNIHFYLAYGTFSGGSFRGVMCGVWYWDSCTRLDIMNTLFHNRHSLRHSLQM